MTGSSWEGNGGTAGIWLVVDSSAALVETSSDSTGGSVYFERPGTGSGEHVFQRVLWFRVGLLLRPIRGVGRLLVAPLLHRGGLVGRDPAALDEPRIEPLDGVVPRRLLDLLGAAVLHLVVLRGVRVEPPDLGVDQGRPFPTPRPGDR